MRHHGCAATNTVSLRTPPRGQEDRREDPSDRSSSIKAEREGTTSTAVVRDARATGTVAVAVQTRQRGIPGHPGPARPETGPLSPAGHAAASWRRRRQQPADHCRSPPPPEGHADATPVAGPPRPRWSPKGPDLGWAGAASPRCPAANGAAAAQSPPPPATGHPAAAQDSRRLKTPPGAAPSRDGEILDGEGPGAATTNVARARPEAGAGAGGREEEDGGGRARGRRGGAAGRPWSRMREEGRLGVSLPEDGYN
nr:translation initiation factor IF-2-like [Aegilops tauschii subsp. strangulata]